MTKTLARLGREFELNTPHVFSPGRQSSYSVPDSTLLGMHEIETTKGLIIPEGTADDQPEIEAQDLGV